MIPNIAWSVTFLLILTGTSQIVSYCKHYMYHNVTKLSHDHKYHRRIAFCWSTLQNVTRSGFSHCVSINYSQGKEVSLDVLILIVYLSFLQLQKLVPVSASCHENEVLTFVWLQKNEVADVVQCWQGACLCVWVSASVRFFPPSKVNKMWVFFSRAFSS